MVFLHFWAFDFCQCFQGIRRAFIFCKSFYYNITIDKYIKTKNIMIPIKAIISAFLLPEIKQAHIKILSRHINIFFKTYIK